MVLERVTTRVRHLGCVNQEGNGFYYSFASKIRVEGSTNDGFDEELGYLANMQDCVIDVDTGEVNGCLREGRVLPNIYDGGHRNNFRSLYGSTIQNRFEAPSSAIESTYLKGVERVRTQYASDPSDVKSVVCNWKEPRNSMGVLLTTNTGRRYLIDNRVGCQSFNVYNSQDIGLEVHKEIDLLMLMNLFLKYNSVWGGNNSLSLCRTDYAFLFFGEEEREDKSREIYDFARERRSLRDNFINSQETIDECRGDVKMPEECRHPVNNVVVIDDIRVCLTCFAKFFFVDWGLELRIADRPSLEGEIARLSSSCNRETLKALRQLARVSFKTHGPSTLNFTSNKDDKPLHQYLLLSLGDLLLSTSHHMDDSKLFPYLNLFGKTLLLFINNCLVLQHFEDQRELRQKATSLERVPLSLMKGRWFSVSFAGPSLFRFQVYSRKVIGAEQPSFSLESRLKLPEDSEDLDCPRRLFFRVHCLAAAPDRAGNPISDVCTSVYQMQTLLNNKRMRMKCCEFENAKTGKKMRIDTENLPSLPNLVDLSKTNEFVVKPVLVSTVVHGDPFVTLEITGLRPIKNMVSRNSATIATRISILMGVRVGSRFKITPDKEVLLLEEIRENSRSSYLARDRLVDTAKILYYDIETTGLEYAKSSITSVCCTLARGRDVRIKSIFALGPPELEKEIWKLYDSESVGDGKTGENVARNPPSNIKVHATELELLTAFLQYVRSEEVGVLTAISGWNSAKFDDIFLMARTVRYLLPKTTSSSRKERSILLGEKEAVEGAGGGVFLDFLPLVDPQTLLLTPLSVEHVNETLMAQEKFTSAAIAEKRPSPCEVFISCISSTSSMDLMKLVAKKYEELLPSMALNYVLSSLCKIDNTDANQKDKVNLSDLLMYHEVSLPKKAIIQRYCCKDAFLVSVVADSICIVDELAELSRRANFSIQNIMGMYVCQLSMIESIFLHECTNERALMRGSAIRHHSELTSTTAGLVSNQLSKTEPLQTLDLSSLYPSIMVQNNLDYGTFASHSSIIALRNRHLSTLTSGTPLERMDEANAWLMERYKPCDLATTHWRNVFSLSTVTALRSLTEEVEHEGEVDCNTVNTVTDLGQFPEVKCDFGLQMSAIVSDDTHVTPSSLEYMIPALLPMVLDNPAIISEVTANTASTLEELSVMMERDFTVEDDERLVSERLPDAEYLKDLPFGEFEYKYDQCCCDDRLMRRCFEICKRVARRVYMYDSADDLSVVLWSNRLINVGSVYRTWVCCANTIKKGVLPTLQEKYKAARVVLKKKMKELKHTEPLMAARCSVEEGATKLVMNSTYGIMVLKSYSKHNNAHASTFDRGGDCKTGVGGGTKHKPLGNAITQVARRVFLNIGNSLRYFFPQCKQANGDTDSIFLVHNTTCESDVEPHRTPGFPAVEMDLLQRLTLARFFPLLANTVTKGIFYDRRVVAGAEFMAIDHERLAVICHTSAKKSYHMVHFDEDSEIFEDLFKTIKKVNVMAGEGACVKGIVAEFEARYPIIKIVPNKAKNLGCVVPHNGKEIIRLLRTNSKAARLNKGDPLFPEGILPDTSREDLRERLTASPYVVAFCLHSLANLYGNTCLETAVKVDISTGEPIVDQDLLAKMAMSSKLFKIYSKNAFNKKGLTARVRFRRFQMFLSSWTNLFDYDEIITNQVKRSISYRDNPNRMVKLVRQNKAPKDGSIKGPNPRARIIGNHLTHTRIGLATKFNVAKLLSGEFLVDPSVRVTELLAEMKAETWNPQIMVGVLTVATARSLTLVPENFNIMGKDEEDVNKLIAVCVGSLVRHAENRGFSLARDCKSYNTGTIFSAVVAKSLVASVIQRINEVPPMPLKPKRKRVERGGGGILCEGLDEVFGTMVINQDNLGSPEISTDTEKEWSRATMEEKLKILHALIPVSRSIYDLIGELYTLRENIVSYTAKEHKRRKKTDPGLAAPKSRLDLLIDSTTVDLLPLLRLIVHHSETHADKCSLKHIFSSPHSFLSYIGGLTECMETCTDAGGCAMLFSSAYCVLLGKMNERCRGRSLDSETMIECLCQEGDPVERMVECLEECRSERVVEKVFWQNYNKQTDTVVLVAPASILMAQPNLISYEEVGIEELRERLLGGALDVKEGDIGSIIGNPRKYYGPERLKLFTGLEDGNLPYMPGIYHRGVLEIMVAMMYGIRGEGIES